ncbi:hypothetical protein B0H12DRAFT_551264 [Mycena haematopus]|nr:hypothetical protein B0H12DRAFT_551264 [Mycena haematopus]
MQQRKATTNDGENSNIAGGYRYEGCRSIKGMGEWIGGDKSTTCNWSLGRVTKKPGGRAKRIDIMIHNGTAFRFFIDAASIGDFAPTEEQQLSWCSKVACVHFGNIQAVIPGMSACRGVTTVRAPRRSTIPTDGQTTSKVARVSVDSISHIQPHT